MEKRTLYYAGLQLDKDKKMCEIFDAIEKNNDAIIIKHGRTVNIVDCRYTEKYHAYELEPTGETHLGFEYHSITVYYKGLIWNIEPASYYPFTDDNNPGEINATPYLLTADNKKIQCGYAQAFTSLEDLQTPIRLKPLSKVFASPITYYMRDFMDVYNKESGFREKEIYAAPHICFETEKNKDHHIIRCEKLERDAYGTRQYFEIDIVTRKISG